VSFSRKSSVACTSQSNKSSRPIVSDPTFELHLRIIREKRRTKQVPDMHETAPVKLIYDPHAG
jgi:hypothetical protein